MLRQPALMARTMSVTIGIALTGFFVAGLCLVVLPFIRGFAWAGVFVLMTWPVYRLLQTKWNIPSAFAALVMSLGATAICFVLVIPVLVELGNELFLLSKERSFQSGQSWHSLLDVPIVSSLIASTHFDRLINILLEQAGAASFEIASKATQTVLSSIFNLGIMLFSSYFFFRYGAGFYQQLEQVLSHYSGLNCQRFFKVAGDAVRGVVYGALVTAMAQGILAGLGFYVAGAPLPALLGMVTILASFIPFGGPLVYVPVSIFLVVVEGQWSAGVGLLAWGILVVSTIDNFLRPLFISQTMRIPLLLVFVGVLGGLFAFGLIGLFIGPVLIALAELAWKELIRASAAAQESN